MAEKDATLSSDDSDDDYVPEGENGNVSEELESGDSEQELDADDAAPPKKRKRKTEPETANLPVEKESNIDKEALWEEFKKETEDAAKNEKKEKLPDIKIGEPSVKPQPKPHSVLEPTTYKSAKGGLSSMLSQLGKKNKVSVLEKSKQDWLNFKQAEGIEEDLRSHNKGKNGFLERRDFLERADHRQFEIEKELRTVKRSSR